MSQSKRYWLTNFFIGLIFLGGLWLINQHYTKCYPWVLVSNCGGPLSVLFNIVGIPLFIIEMLLGIGIGTLLAPIIPLEQSSNINLIVNSLLSLLNYLYLGIVGAYLIDKLRRYFKK